MRGVTEVRGASGKTCGDAVGGGDDEACVLSLPALWPIGCAVRSTGGACVMRGLSGIGQGGVFGGDSGALWPGGAVARRAVRDSVVTEHGGPSDRACRSRSGCSGTDRSSAGKELAKSAGRAPSRSVILQRRWNDDAHPGAMAGSQDTGVLLDRWAGPTPCAILLAVGRDRGVCGSCLGALQSMGTGQMSAERIDWRWGGLDMGSSGAGLR